MPWEQLAAIRRLAAAEAEAASRRVESCPQCGEPYKQGPHGELFCPADGFQPGAGF